MDNVIREKNGLGRGYFQKQIVAFIRNENLWFNCGLTGVTHTVVR